jgi:hypothetical protein
MKSCLDDNELLRLWADEPGESAESRAHLAQCQRCAAAYDQIASDAKTIATALSFAADHLRWRNSSAAIIRNGYSRIGRGLRTGVIFGAATAFGGVAAFSVMVALGWHSGHHSFPLANAATSAVVARASLDTRSAAAAPATVAGVAAASFLTSNLTGASDSYDAVTDDPLAGFTYNGSARPGDFANSGAGLLFCVPDEDGSLCSPSAGQG